MHVIRFERDQAVESKADICERFGNFCIGLLPLDMGKTVKVTKSPTGRTVFEESTELRLHRFTISFFKLSLLIFSPLLIGIGCLGYRYSKSHRDTTKQYVEFASRQPEPEPSPPSTAVAEVRRVIQDNFHKKFDRAISINSHPKAKQILQQIIGSFRVHENLGSIFDAWMGLLRQEEKNKTLSEEEILLHVLERGTCYGHSMQILEVIVGTKREFLSEEYIHKSMELKAYVRYQILHHMDIYFKNASSARVKGIPTKHARSILAKAFPHHQKKSKTSEKLALLDLRTEMLTGRLGDFIRNDVKAYDTAERLHDFAIKITLDGKESGHMAIMYYSENEKRHFWYDPSNAEYGLWSSDNFRDYVRGVAVKIIEYKGHFDTVKFTAYHI